jgi:hypothetical protein
MTRSDLLVTIIGTFISVFVLGVITGLGMAGKLGAFLSLMD